MILANLSVMSIEIISAAICFTASQQAELQPISLTSHPDRSAREKRVRKKVSSAMDSGVSRQRKNVNVKLPKEK